MHFGIEQLDLDEIAWEAPGVREDIEKSVQKLRSFLSDNSDWVIEGCYGSLISEAVLAAHEIVFLNPGTVACQENCKSRPWEPHKYNSKEAQDANLNMLLNWVAEYETRTDEFSLAAHRNIFDSYQGRKQEIKSNLEAQNKANEVRAFSRDSKN